jgi:hypothetical protein
MGNPLGELWREKPIMRKRETSTLGSAEDGLKKAQALSNGLDGLP